MRGELPSWAREGEKVECVSSTIPSGMWANEFSVVEGETYTIREVVQVAEGVGLRLRELVNPPMPTTSGRIERAYRLDRFRPT